MVRLGDVIDGKYQLRRLIGEGGMGAVYEGENTRIHRKVAIKVLHAEIAKNQEAMLRFEREAQAAGKIGSEHIIEILDLGDLPNGDRYLVMEFLEGESLGARLQREGTMAPRDIGPIALDVLNGLAAAHQAGIVHRDLKPDNIYLLTERAGRKDFVKILDFGISKFSGMGPELSLTRTGAVLGTPYYMAPEQATGSNRIDHRVDVYAVGVLLYQAVSGDLPFQADTFNELLVKLVVESPVPLGRKRPEIDREFIAIVERAMARRPDDRFRDADDFASALQAFLGGTHLPAGRTLAAGTPTLDKTLLPGDETTNLGVPPQPLVARTATAPRASLDLSSGTLTRPEDSRTTADSREAPPVPPLRHPPTWKILGGAILLLVVLVGWFWAQGSREEKAPPGASEGRNGPEKSEDLRSLERELEAAREAQDLAEAQADTSQRAAERQLLEQTPTREVPPVTGPAATTTSPAKAMAPSPAKAMAPSVPAPHASKPVRAASEPTPRAQEEAAPEKKVEATSSNRKEATPAPASAPPPTSPTPSKAGRSIRVDL